MSALREILADPIDSNLCDRLFVRIAECYGNELDVTRETEQERTVSLVWHSYGIIGNGGFSYLLEGNFKGSPGFRDTAKSYRSIGCETAAACFDRLFSAFPKGEIPADIDKRLRRYQKSFSELRFSGGSCESTRIGRAYPEWLTFFNHLFGGIGKTGERVQGPEIYRRR